MRRRATFSWEAHWREAYATGQIDLAEFERLIVTALRAEHAPKRERTKRPSAKQAAENWGTATDAKVANYMQGIQSGTWLLSPQESPTT